MNFALNRLRFLLSSKVLLTLALLWMLSTAANAQTTTGTTIDGLIWSAAGKAVTITGYSGAGGAVTIPATISVSGSNQPVTSIGNNAFLACSSLTGVTIPNSVTSIGSSAFQACSNLTGLAIPNSVTNIGYAAFFVCAGVTSITVDPTNPAFSSLAGVLFDKSQATLIQYPIGNIASSYTIPDSVITIGANAFGNCTHLTSVAIGNSVTSIGSSAFGSCTRLATVTLPVSVTSIASGAFIACNSLKTVTLPSFVTSIGSSAFDSCISLTTVTIPGSVTSIGKQAFDYCSSLKTAIFLGNAPTTGSSVFLSAASGFTVYYYEGGTGFTSPTWMGYPAVNMGPGSPIVASGTADETLYNGTTLNGTLNSDGLETTFYFQYGTTALFGNFTGMQSVGNGTTAVPASVSIAGLNPATTYSYQLVAINSSGTTYGPLQTFTTTQQLGYATTTTKIAQSGSDIHVSIPSLTGYSYQLQRSSLLSGTTSWQNIGGAKPGTGGVLTLVDSGGALLNSGFYCIQVSQ